MLKQKSSHKTMFAVIILTVLVAVGGLVWKNYFRSDKQSKTPTSQGGINYAPPSEEVKKETEEFKKNLEQKPETQAESPTPDSGQASVVITNIFMEGGKVRGAGIVSNIFEEGGTCTLALIKGSQKLTGTSQGIQDVNKTTCPPIYITASSGQWTATLSYSSPTIRGTSASQVMQVP